MAETVKTALKPHLASGAIADKDSFKHLCRKLSKELVAKEKTRASASGMPRWHSKIAPAAERYVAAYMTKLRDKGTPVYKKS